MKTVLFLRHGKSDWDAEYDHDHERPLAKRGVNAARKIGRLLASIDAIPDSAVSSTAVRARTTCGLAAEAGAWGCPVRETGELYGASSKDVLREIRAERESTSRLLLVGHEPTWSETVSELTGGSHVRFPTATIARIDFQVNTWSEIAFGMGMLIWLIPPKTLRDA